MLSQFHLSFSDFEGIISMCLYLLLLQSTLLCMIHCVFSESSVHLLCSPTYFPSSVHLRPCLYTSCTTKYLYYEFHCFAQYNITFLIESSSIQHSRSWNTTLGCYSESLSYTLHPTEDNMAPSSLEHLMVGISDCGLGSTAAKLSLLKKLLQ